MWGTVNGRNGANRTFGPLSLRGDEPFQVQAVPASRDWMEPLGPSVSIDSRLAKNTTAILLKLPDGSGPALAEKR